MCHERGLHVDFGFLIRSSMNKHPGITYFLIFACSAYGFAQLCRIFERPYYGFCFDPPMEDFRSLNTALFFVIMTMASAGFGDITTTTQIGRWLTLGIACWGAVMLSLLFAIIGDVFDLDENRLKVLTLVGEQKLAAKAMSACLRYNVIKRKRYRILDAGEADENCPT